MFYKFTLAKKQIRNNHKEEIKVYNGKRHQRMPKFLTSIILFNSISEIQKTKSRKQRFSFTIDKDIRLLRLALCANPWQTGSDRWNDVVKLMEMEYHTRLTMRTVSGRINLLRENFKKQQLRSKTGTEEQETERGRLLLDIEAIISEEDAAVEINDLLNDETDDVNINGTIDANVNDTIDANVNDTNDVNGNDDAHGDSNANDDDFICTPEVIAYCQEKNSSQDDPTLDKDDDDDGASDSPMEQHSQTCNSSNKRKSAKRKFGSERPKNVQQSRKAEREKADAERKKYLDEADEPVNRRFRGRLTIEDEMIMKRQDHEIEMEKERLVLEKERLEIDKRREIRLEEEARRRDELHMSQLLLHQTTMVLITKALEKN